MNIFLSDIETTFKVDRPKIWSDKDIIDPIINNMPSDIITKLDQHKKSLNETKNKLNKYSKKDFDNIFRNFDFYGDLRSFYQNRKGAQICSNAWLKAYEMIENYQLIGNKRAINVFYNAELPGAFISATNHYCKTHEVDFQWLASSYLPAEGDTGDQDIIGDKCNIYANYKKNWLMDKKMNGDLTIPENLVQIKNSIKRRFNRGVDLYFSDAGMDVGEDYDNQEEINALLNYGQTLSGLMVLAPGGHLVVKQYTFFSALNTSLITLLSNMFREFYIIKPLTSRPTNSEVYLLGRNYIGLIPNLEQHLLGIMSSLKTIGNTVCANYSFYQNSLRIQPLLDRLVSVSETIFINGQKPLLETAIQLIDSTPDMSILYEKLGPIHIQKQDMFISKFNVRKLYTDEHLNTRPPFIKEEKKKSITSAKQIGGGTQFGSVFSRNASARLFYTFLQIFNKPFNFKKPEELAVSKRLYELLESDVKKGLDDATIYNNLYVNINQLYYSVFGGPNIFTEDRANYRVESIKEIIFNLDVLPELVNYIDFGCGEASITTAVAKAIGAKNIQGMDIKEPNHTLDFPFVKLDPSKTHIPVEDNSINLISCFMVLHHLTNPADYIKEFYRVLNTNGLLLIREHDIEGDTDPDGKLFLDMLHGFYEVVWAKTGEQENPDFVKNYLANYKNRYHWTDMIEQAGFSRLSNNKLDNFYNDGKRVRDYQPGKRIKNPFHHYYAIYIKK